MSEIRLIAVVWITIALAGPAAQAAGTRTRRPTAYEFFQPVAIQGVRLNPSGDLFIAVVTTHGIASIRVQEVGDDRGADVVRYVSIEAPEIFALSWVGDRIAIVSLEGGKAHHVIRVDTSEKNLRLEFDEILHPGLLVDALPEREGEVLWAPYSDPKSVYEIHVDALTERRSRNRSPFDDAQRLSRMKQPPVRWYVGGRGHPRLARTRDDDGRSSFWIRRLDRDAWRFLDDCWRLDDDWVIPIALHSDERSLVVASSAPTGRTGLYTCDPDSDGELAPLLVDADRDLMGVVPSADGRTIIGGYFFAAGAPKFQYLKESEQVSWTEVEGLFPNASVWPISGGGAGRPRALWVGSMSDAGRYVLIDEQGGVVELGRVAPWLDRRRLGETRFFSFEVPEVGQIEAYLTLPPTGEPSPPLIVYPHGGPIGVMEYPVFDRRVHYLASSGYAVLRVNYRGSAGFGRDFEEAGYRQWGRGIEDDIDAAIDWVLSKGLASNDRICVIGGSYGGYSALMSTIRHPGRFACAVSRAGVTDLGLLFDPSEVSQSTEALRKNTTEQVGDPEHDYEEMIRHSPVYRVAEIETPLLIVHGSDDLIVDVEHALRLQLMLELYDKPHRIEIVPGVGHGGWPRRKEQRYFERVRKFIDYHLE